MVLEALRPGEVNVEDGLELYKSWVARYPAEIPKNQVPTVFRLRDGGAAIEELRANGEFRETLDNLSPKERKLCENALREAETINQYAELCNLRLVIHLASSPLKRRLPLMDAIQEGNLSLRRGVEKFDYTKGVTPSTYFSWWIKQGIRRAAGEELVIPLPSYMNGALLKARRAANRFEQENGRPPRKNELVGLLEAEGVRSTTALAAAQIFESPIEPVSLDAVIDDDDGTTLKDFIAAPDSVEDEVKGKVVWEEFAAKLDSLPERYRRILELRAGGETLEKAGEELGVTREGARQIEARAKRKLRELVLRDYLDSAAEEVGKTKENNSTAELPEPEPEPLCTLDSDERAVNIVFLENIEEWGQAVVDYVRNEPRVWNRLTSFEKTFLGLYFSTDAKSRGFLKQRLAIIFKTKVPKIDEAVIMTFLVLKENLREFLQSPAYFENGFLAGLPEEGNNLLETEEFVLTEKELSLLLWSIQKHLPCRPGDEGSLETEKDPEIRSGLLRKLAFFIKDKETVFLANAANPEAQRALTLVAWLQLKKDILELLG